MHTYIPMQCCAIFFSHLYNALNNRLWKVPRTFLCVIIQLFSPPHFSMCAVFFLQAKKETVLKHVSALKGCGWEEEKFITKVFVFR